MIDAIKRVISGEDMQQQQQQQQQESSPRYIQTDEGYDDTIGMQIDDDSQNNGNTNNSSCSPRPAVVENDMDMVDASDFHIASASETPRSSLSDMSAAQRLSMDDETMDEAMGVDRQEATSSKPPPGSSSAVVIKTMHRSNQGQQALRNLDAYRNSDEGSSVGKTGGSQTSSRDWGWFEDVHASDGALAAAAESPGGGSQTRSGQQDRTTSNKRKTAQRNTITSLVPSQGSLYHETLQPILRDPETDAAAMAVTAPTYVLEESLSSQRLWKDTAGQRPPQPVEERAFFEKMWAQNFARSQVEYRMPVEVLTATTPISLNPFADGNFDAQGGPGNSLSNYNLADSSADTEAKKKQHPSDMAEAALMRKLYEPARGEVGEGESHNAKVTMTCDGDTLTVLVKGDNVFGTTVSKSFVRPSDNGGPTRGVDTVNISVASYRVVESKKHGKYAQFLVIYREGSIRDTIGVWKRYSDFQELSRKVTQAHEGCAAVIANMSPLAVTEEHEVEHLPNAITSWRLLKKRQRWWRCLDAGYLSLKVFLLERFLHDILFESSNPDLLREFVGVPEPRR